MSPWGLAFLPIILAVERAYALRREARQQEVMTATTARLAILESRLAELKNEFHTDMRNNSVEVLNLRLLIINRLSKTDRTAEHVEPTPNPPRAQTSFERILKDED